MERRAVIDAATQAGARDTYLIEEPLAAALGADMPVREAAGNMVVDLGGGTTEVAVISMGKIVLSRTLRLGGDALDESLVQYIRRQYNLMISPVMAERMKMEIGSLAESTQPQTMEIRGRDLLTGLPKPLSINQNQLLPALYEPLREIIDVVKTTLEMTPPELASDIMDRGIVLTGGGALFAQYRSGYGTRYGHARTDCLRCPFCVVLGTGRAARNFNSFRRKNHPAKSHK